MKLPPYKGGCWYCFQDDEKEGLVYCRGFDTNLHISCLQKSLREHPSGPEHAEAVLIAREVLEGFNE